MRTTRLTGWFSAAVLVSAVTVAAQGQQPSSQPTGTQKSDDRAQTVTVAGCVQKEADVLKRPAMAGNVGMNDEFVLTQAMVNPAPAAAEAPAPDADTKPEPTGTSGSASNFGKVYRVTGDKEADLKTYVGTRVEISGAFKREADAKRELGPSGTSGASAPAELTPDNTPEITVASIRPASGSCAGGAVR